MPREAARLGPQPGELAEKERRVRALLASLNLDAIVLARLSNFFWFTGGRNCAVFFGGERGEAILLITSSKKYLIVPNVEQRRLAEEEGLEEQGFEFVVEPWWTPGCELSRLTAGLRLGADVPFADAVDVSDAIARLRLPLLPIELERFRWLGHAAAEALETTARAAEPGLAESEIAGFLANECIAREIAPVLLLVGTDERAFRYRRPIPTAKPLQRYGMLSLSARRSGLVASAARSVHFGSLTDALRRKEAAVAQVDAAYIAATCAGARIADILYRASLAYADAGFPEEWREQHQGGAVGYESREWQSGPESAQVVAENQAFAWNPSITGVQSQDTLLLTTAGREVITASGSWPQIGVNVGGDKIDRPAILQR